MDKYGQGVEFQFCNIMRNKGLDFNNFTRQMILEMCIMSGCDYLPSLPGMGVKRAHGLIKRFKSYQKVGIFNCSGALCWCLSSRFEETISDLCQVAPMVMQLIF